MAYMIGDSCVLVDDAGPDPRYLFRDETGAWVRVPIADVESTHLAGENREAFEGDYLAPLAETARVLGGRPATLAGAVAALIDELAHARTCFNKACDRCNPAAPFTDQELKQLSAHGDEHTRRFLATIRALQKGDRT